MYFLANQAALLLANLAFVWVKFAQVSHKASHWRWYDENYGKLQCMPKRSFYGPIWFIVDVMFALFGFFALFGYTDANFSGGDATACPHLIVANVVLYILTAAALKLYTPVFLVRGSNIGAIVLSAFAVVAHFANLIAFGVAWGNAKCTAAETTGYGTAALVIGCLLLIWFIYALFNSARWAYYGYPTPFIDDAAREQQRQDTQLTESRMQSMRKSLLR